MPHDVSCSLNHHILVTQWSGLQLQHLFEYTVWSITLRQFVIDFNIVLATPMMALVPSYTGSCPSLWFHQWPGEGGPAALASACLPYHPCPDTRDVERGDLLHGQQPVFHMTVAQTSGTWRGGTCCMGNSLSSIPPLPRSASWRGSSSAAAKWWHNTDCHSHIGLHSHNRCCSSASWSWLFKAQIHGHSWPMDATVLDHNYYDHCGITALNTYTG